MEKLIKKINEFIKNDYKTQEKYDKFIFKNLNSKIGLGRGFMVFSSNCYSEREAKKLKLENYPYQKRYYYVEELNKNNKRNIIFVLFNCSNSNPEKLDDSVKNCKFLSANKGYRRIEVLNLFSVRNANVSKIKNSDLKNDNDNFDFIIELLKSRKNCDIVLAWGYGKENEKEFVKNRIENFTKELNCFAKANNMNLLKISVNLEKVKNEIESKARHPGNQAWALFCGFRRAAQLTKY